MANPKQDLGKGSGLSPKGPFPTDAALPITMHGGSSLPPPTAPRQGPAIQPAALQGPSPVPTGPLSKAIVLPPKKRRGGRPASGKQSGKRRQADPEAVPLDPQTRRQETALTRKLKACSRCERQKIRCVPDSDDPLGPCLTCIRAKCPCPRFSPAVAAAAKRVRQLMPHKVDVYRVHVESFDAHDERRVYIIEPAELSGLGNLPLPMEDLTVNLDRYADRLVVPLLLVTFSSVNQTDAEDLKWDAVQLGYKLAYNPLRTSDAAVLRYFFRMWVLIATYDLMLPFIGASAQLEADVRRMIRDYAVKILGEMQRLMAQNREEGRFAMHLILYIIALCCFSGGTAPSDVPVRFDHIPTMSEMFDTFRGVVLGDSKTVEDVMFIFRGHPDVPLRRAIAEEVSEAV